MCKNELGVYIFELELYNLQAQKYVMFSSFE